jgi:flagellar protein FlgJ
MIQAVPTSPAAAGTPDAKQAKLKSAAQAFEAVFLRQMIGSMRQAGLSDGMLDSDAGDTFQNMADSKLADSMAQKGVLGIANLLVKQIGPIAAQQAAAADHTDKGTSA